MKTLRIISLILVAATVLALAVTGTVAAEYSDVATARWSHDAIAYASEKGYMNGVGDGKFDPAGTMQRAMIVTVLYRMEGEPEVEYTKVFKDVPDGKYYTSAVLWAFSKKIVSGTTPSTFDPAGAVTREQMATFFFRYAEYKCVDTSLKNDIKGYSDYSQISQYAVDAFAWANKVGLISGDTPTTLSPKKTATREQFSTILQRYDNAELSYDIVYNTPVLKSSFTPKDYGLVNNADFYVAENGKDSDPGTFDKPFATFERAKEAVRELKKTAEDGIVVAFKAGTYPAPDTIFTEEDSGTESVPVMYCAYGDGEVLFDGGFTVKASDFKPLESSDCYMFRESVRGDIMRADISDAEGLSAASELFSDTKRMDMARYPNKISEREQGYLEKLTTYTSQSSIGLSRVAAKRVATYHTFENAFISGFYMYEFTCRNVALTGYDKDTCELFFAETPFQGISQDPANHKVFLYNISEELDNDREYYIDVKNKVLYVYKPEGDYHVSTSEHFATVDRADHITFRGFTMKHCTGNGFDINGNYITVESCTLFGTGGDYAIKAYGNHLTVDSCDMSHLYGGGVWTDAGVETLNPLIDCGTVITNNLIHDFMEIYRIYRPGVRINNNVGVTVSHNEIYNAPHSAVIYGSAAEDSPNGLYSRAINCTIEYNYIHDVLEDSGDCGTIYSGRSSVNRGNIIRYNVISAKGGGFGIYLDDAICDQTVYGNIFYDAASIGILHSGGRDCDIYDNVFICNGENKTALDSRAKYSEMQVDGSAWDSGNFRRLYQTYSDIPAEGTPERELWKEVWPELFEVNMDYTAVDDPKSVVNTSDCILKNNYAIGGIGNSIADRVVMFAKECDNNRNFTIDENPMFVCPALGDYSTVEGADFTIPFAEIGRY